MKIAALKGALANLGDFLIAERCEELIKYIAGNVRFTHYPSFDNFDEHIEEINKADCLVIMGGPGFRPNMYPGVYPLVDDLKKIKIPIVLFGTGWKGPANASPSEENFYARRFTKTTLNLLNRIIEDSDTVSVRDYHTQRICHHLGIFRVTMTGCPVWYNLNFMGIQYTPPTSIMKIGFSLPVNQHYFQYALSAIESIQKLFPKAEIVPCFHHGIKKNQEWYSDNFFTLQNSLNVMLKKRGLNPVDLSGSIDNQNIYDTFDFHIGYRVHAHILQLSKRKTSYLLYEDGRGSGVNQALGLKGIDDNINIKYKNKFVNSIDKRIDKYFERDLKEYNQYVYNFLRRELDSNFISLFGIDKKIDMFWEKSMEPYLSNTFCKKN